jgi:hypothetical protein
MSNWSDEETNSPLRADDHDFYKVEKCQTSAADQADYPAADSARWSSGRRNNSRMAK